MKSRKQMLKFIWNTCKLLMMKCYPSFTAQFLWTLKFISSTSHDKYFLELFQANIYVLYFKKMQKGLQYT